MAGLLACDSPSRRLPGLSTSGIMPFVLAYSGGSAGDSSKFQVRGYLRRPDFGSSTLDSARLVASIPATLIVSPSWNLDFTPLPFKARVGTLIRYSIFIQPQHTVTLLEYHALNNYVKDDPC